MICSSCGSDNPAGAHFCGNCGATFTAAAEPPPPSAEPPAAAPPPPPPPSAEPPAAAPPPPPPPTAPMVPPAPIPPVPPTAPVPPVTSGPIPPIPPVPPTAPPAGTDPTLVGGLPPVPPGPPDATTAFPTPPPAGPPVAAEKKSKKALVIGLVALLLVGALVGSFLVLGGDDDGGGAGEVIVLEPIGQTLRDDFAGNLDIERFDGSLAISLPDVPPLDDGIASTLSARRASGDEPGLYGGTRDVGTCDVEQLVDFLTDPDNAEKAEAWAEVQGIDVDGIEDFIDDLTPVRLRFDTRVTNHGFTNGAANGFQSVLEAGTAVLVDDTGVPRVKCNCGNPLAEPADLGDVDENDALDADALVQNIDDAWDGFDPEVIVVVVAGDTLDEFVLVDIDSGELFTRPVGDDGDDGNDGDVDPDELCVVFADSPTCGAPPDDETTTTGVDDETTTTIVLGTGDVQITLEWPSTADLDLAVTDPNGERLSFGNRGPNSTGGQLDVDSNVGCDEGDSGVENVFWPPGQAPAGDYVVEVDGFSVDDGGLCGGGDYVLTIRVAGEDDQVIRDSVASGETDTFDFSVAG